MTTIFALASAPGVAGVAVFRVSGPQARAALDALCQPQTEPPARQATLRMLRHPVTYEAIDRALVLVFPAPHSFTGEDVVELHTHGGRAVAAAVTEALRALPGLRLAEPGEFTRRAFENGRLDLTEAEAIADLVHAETEAQRRQALRQLDGALGELYEGWRGQLTRALAHLEAAIDFADEDLPDDMVRRQLAVLRDLRDGIEAHLRDGHIGERIRDGFAIALIGPPNAGKSSLLNALARRDAAIVSATPGTTRDIVEVQLDLGGYAVTVADTAGLRETGDAIESEGIRRARARAAQADLKLLVLDGSQPRPDDGVRDLIDAATIVIVNKSDVARASLSCPVESIAVSALTGAGIDALTARLTAIIGERLTAATSAPLTRARHRAALGDCLDHLDRALSAPLADMRAEDVRLAMRALGRITGRVDVEDLLDVIFRDFCIGK